VPYLKFMKHKRQNSGHKQNIGFVSKKKQQNIGLMYQIYTTMPNIIAYP
jgi:hypothetical protein